ncbi:MAG TPA: sugar phosphate nucleotidyltransferase [candidate division Zixibacteria bacterium]|nr:sugar phosphate nucleotidyltransferase [candidate division Zixibacteria bacterium]
MKAIIMAGGFGTRLRPLTINIPKPMVPIANVPMMEHVVTLLCQHGITDITALLYHQAEKITEHFGNGSHFDVRMEYVQPDDDYGTAGAVRYALADCDEPVLIISGDLLTDFNLTQAMAWHKEKKSDATLLLTRMENPLAYGIVITDGDGRIVRFLEKPSWGEAFSDTINTGIYLLEPSAYNLIPPQTNFDFSQDLFPLMLSKEMGLHGKIMDGYWKDVGNVGEYRLAHVDFFDGSLQLELKLQKVELEKGILYKGLNVHLEPGVELEGRVVLGNDVTIGAHSHLTNCVVGHRSRIGHGAELTNTIIWNDNSIGAEAGMTDAIVCTGSRIGRGVTLLDNVIVSDECQIGDSATVKANCKIWPGKMVDPGAIVSTSVVWGDKWNRELFTNSKVAGLALTEITPEMLVRLGAAFGAFVGQGNSVVTSRDASDTSRLLKRGLISGLLAAGVHVSDFEMLPIPVVRYGLRRGEYSAGIYVRHNPEDYRRIDIIFFDGNGLDLPTAKSKKVERLYFGEDFERAGLDQIGHLDMEEHVLEDYREDFLKAIDSNIIREAGFKLVVDHSNGASSQVFPTLFFNLGISAIELNANLNPRKFAVSPEEQSQAIVQLSSIVTSLHCDVGFLLNSAAEKLTAVDETGKPIDPQLFLLIVVDLFLRTNKATKIAVPVGASMGVEEIAAEHNVEVIRVANDHLSMMEIHRRGEVDFVGGTRGGFIMPGFQHGSDAMLAAVKLLEMMALTHSRLGSLRKRFEGLVRKSASVPCPWSRKGTVMRKLIVGSEDKQRQLIDGVRIFEDDGWVLVTPDRTTASFNILAESRSRDGADLLVDRYRSMVEESQVD